MWNKKPENSPRQFMRTDKTVLRQFSPAFHIQAPAQLTSPIVLASPHSGRKYPDELLQLCGLPLEDLRQSEDCYIDLIAKSSAAHGIPLLSANFPRMYVDVNRAPSEICPGKTSPLDPHITTRARAGLGVVPTKLSYDIDLYNADIPGHSVARRLKSLYHPYHGALRALLKNARAAFGQALLIDLHSMPGTGSNGEKRADIVLGDRYGDSCLDTTMECLETAFLDLGYSVARNEPYAGGYVTAHYGRPLKGQEAIQIEINRDLYLNPNSFESNEGLQSLQSDLAAAAQALINHVRDKSVRLYKDAAQ